MAHRPRSLQHEYELFVEREIENYKESVPRRVILSIGDEAVQSLAAQQQLVETEVAELGVDDFSARPAPVDLLAFFACHADAPVGDRRLVVRTGLGGVTAQFR